MRPHQARALLGLEPPGECPQACMDICPGAGPSHQTHTVQLTWTPGTSSFSRGVWPGQWGGSGGRGPGNRIGGGMQAQRPAGWEVTESHRPASPCRATCRPRKEGRPAPLVPATLLLHGLCWEQWPSPRGAAQGSRASWGPPQHRSGRGGPANEFQEVSCEGPPNP